MKKVFKYFIVILYVLLNWNMYILLWTVNHHVLDWYVYKSGKLFCLISNCKFETETLGSFSFYIFSEICIWRITCVKAVYTSVYTCVYVQTYRSAEFCDLKDFYGFCSSFLSEVLGKIFINLFWWIISIFMHKHIWIWSLIFVCNYHIWEYVYIYLLFLASWMPWMWKAKMRYIYIFFSLCYGLFWVQVT